MNKSKFLSIIIVLLLVSNGVLIYFLVGKPPRPEGPKALIIEQLHFDAKQIKTYELLIQKHRSQINREEQQIRQLKQELYQELNKTVPKKDSIIAELVFHQKRIEDIHYEHFEDIKAICKPAQLPYFKKLTHELARLFAHKAPPKRP